MRALSKIAHIANIEATQEDSGDKASPAGNKPLLAHKFYPMRAAGFARGPARYSRLAALPAGPRPTAETQNDHRQSMGVTPIVGGCLGSQVGDSHHTTASTNKIAARISKRFIVSSTRGVSAWANHWGVSRAGQISAVAKTLPKKSAVLKREFPSAISPASLAAKRPTNSLLSAPVNIRVLPSVGYRERAERRRQRSMPCLPISLRGSIDVGLPQPQDDRHGPAARRTNCLAACADGAGPQSIRGSLRRARQVFTSLRRELWEHNAVRVGGTAPQGFLSQIATAPREVLFQNRRAHCGGFFGNAPRQTLCLPQREDRPSRLDPLASNLTVNTAGTEPAWFGKRYRARRLQQGLLAPRLRRESAGLTATAQMRRVLGCKRAEVQGSAPSIKGSGRLPANFISFQPSARVSAAWSHDLGSVG